MVKKTGFLWPGSIHSTVATWHLGIQTMNSSISFWFRTSLPFNFGLTTTSFFFCHVHSFSPCYHMLPFHLSWQCWRSSGLSSARNDAVDVLHGFGDPSSFVAAAAIAHLQCLVDASGRSTGYDGAEGAITSKAINCLVFRIIYIQKSEYLHRFTVS